MDQLQTFVRVTLMLIWYYLKEIRKLCMFPKPVAMTIISPKICIGGELKKYRKEN